jgi:hypothetical protein
LESSTQCNDAKQEHQEKRSNPSLSNPTKATNAMEKLKWKNKERNQQITPIFISQEFPHKEGEWIGGVVD